MICPNCKSNVSDDSKFCPICGAALQQKASAGEAPAAAAGGTAQAAAVPAAKKSLKINPKIAGIIIAAAAAAVILIAVAAGYRPAVDADKYLSAAYSTYDTVGKAEVTFDADAFVNDNAKKVKLDKKQLAKYGDRMGLDTEFSGSTGDMIDQMVQLGIVQSKDTAAAELLSQTLELSFSVSPTEKLSNGDKVSLKWTFSEDEKKEIEDVFHCRLQADPTEFTVDGLKKLGSFDPFDGIGVNFVGTAPAGVATVTGTGSAREGLNYQLDKNSGLNNGDTVTVTVSTNTGETLSDYCANTFGEIPSKTSSTFTVQGLPTYVQSLSEIPADTMKEMQAQTLNVVKTFIDGDYTDQSSVSEITCKGSYFLKMKDSNSQNGSDAVNCCYVIAQCDVTNNDFGTVRVYYPVPFQDLLIDKDGKCTYSGGSDILGSSHIDSYSTKGYMDPSALYNDLVSQYSSTYDAETDEGLKDFEKVSMASSLSDLSGEAMKSLKDTASAMVENYLKDTFDDDVKIGKAVYKESYLLTNKDSGGTPANILYVVMAVKLTGKTSGNEVNVYYPVSFISVETLQDGSAAYLDSEGIKGLQGPSSGWVIISDGYKDHDAMKEDLITSQENSFNVETDSKAKD
jgi:hypothetical protein